MTQMTKTQLTQTLRAYRNQGLQKVSVLGGEPAAGFESSFASLAFVYIQDRAPALLDYMVGFQLVDRNEDNTKAVGIFGFKLDKQWIYAPVFFLHGDLKGHELLYLKGQDTFVPMKENWVNYLLSRQPIVLGNPTHESLRQLGNQNPNLASFSQPPQFGKFSSAMPKMAGWARDILPTYAQWCLKHPDRLDKFAGLDERLNLANVLRQDVRLVKSAVDAMAKYPFLKQAFHQYYAANTLPDALRDLRQRILAEPSGILEVKSAAATKQPKIQVITSEVITVNAPEMNEQERERLLRDGLLIRDTRTGEEVSKAYNVQIPKSLSSPDATGIYDVMMKDGNFDRCLIVHSPFAKRNPRNRVVLVRLSDKATKGCHAGNVFCQPSSDSRGSDERYSDWFDKAETTAKLKKDAKYVILSAGGQGTGVFSVEEVMDDDCYRVYWSSLGHDSPELATAHPSSIYSSDEYCDCIVFNARKGTRLKSMGNKLYVPPDAKCFKISDPPHCEKCNKAREGCSCEYFHHPYSSECELQPGDIADLQLQILQKTAEVKIWHDANEVIVNRLRMPKKAGLLHLVRDHGFTERAARHMLKESERTNGKRYRVKYAQPYPGMYDATQGPGAPSFPEYDIQAGDPSTGYAPSTAPQSNFMPIDEMSAQQTDPSVYDNSPDLMPDPGSMQVAQQASQTGQKEVFDASMLSGLLRAVRDTNLVERYMGDLMKALDRLGRIYFLFLWHNEEFMNRYGKADLPELEDALRNSFEGMGDLILFLRAKSVGPLEGLGELGEPSVDNAALN